MIVPTYNEAGNIAALLDELFALRTRERTGWDLHVLVRDDRSPDGTGEIVEEIASGKHRGKVILSRGTKQGLGKALELAFAEALDRGYEVVMTMDADFSHAPVDVVPLLQAIESGADVAVGSRYTPGGLIPGDWPLSQIVRTRVAGTVARGVGGIDPGLRELTTNFRAMRRVVLESIDFDRVRARGYGFQIFLANAFTTGGWNVTEVPISFHTRAHGVSKASVKDVLEFVRIAVQLNDDSPFKQLVRFLLVGVSGTLVNLGSLWLLRQIFMPEDPVGDRVWLLSAAAIQISILWNFIWHTAFTFKRYRRVGGELGPRQILVNLAKFEGASALTQTVIFGAFVVFSNLGVFYLIAQALGIVIAVAVNYWVSSHYIWDWRRRLSDVAAPALASPQELRRAA
ncbi:glycosyltransferase [Demequina sp. SYSU T00039]|uniref:Glycosyltransferase n=1 Tax=Demequina lignilytica TaxID=3051663 RepID=A0AAW7M7Y8_9MICO|nr:MULTISPECIES: glycosyltransferase [unclassified Demequina]MDN4486591.1 glycosyltransferase [Demequina sp. SYSU T00039]MDN4489277.1 glycosyltransferase [Demequina sp. SYSU T00068]